MECNLKLRFPLNSLVENYVYSTSVIVFFVTSAVFVPPPKPPGNQPQATTPVSAVGPATQRGGRAPPPPTPPGYGRHASGRPIHIKKLVAFSGNIFSWKQDGGL